MAAGGLAAGGGTSGIANGVAAGVAVVGCGYWGRNLVRNFAELGALAAVVDPNPATAAALSAEHGAPARSFEEVLADPAIAAIATASPAALHFAVASQALKAGKDVFVEKPIALSVTDGEALRDLAASLGRVLMVGHLLQYHPAYLRLRALVEDGAIGTLRYVYSNRLSLGKLRTEEDVVWSFAPHDISMVLGLTGGEAPIRVTAHRSYPLGADLADSAHLHLEFASGLKAHVFASWLHPFKEHRLVATGERGSLVLDDTKPWDEKLVLTEHEVTEGPALRKGRVSAVPVAPGEPLKAECAHFLEAVSGRLTPRTDAEEALAVLRVLRDAEPKGAGAALGRAA